MRAGALATVSLPWHSTTNHWAAAQGTRARALAEAFPCGAPLCRARRPTEVLMPLVEFCLKHTTSKTNQIAKGQPPGKKGQPLCFRAGYFTLPDVFPHLFPAYHSPLRDEEIFHGI